MFDPGPPKFKTWAVSTPSQLTLEALELICPYLLFPWDPSQYYSPTIFSVFHKTAFIKVFSSQTFYAFPFCLILTTCSYFLALTVPTIIRRVVCVHYKVFHGTPTRLQKQQQRQELQHNQQPGVGVDMKGVHTLTWRAVLLTSTGTN